MTNENVSQLIIPTQAPLTKVESATNYMASTPATENANAPSNNSVELLYDPSKYTEEADATPPTTQATKTEVETKVEVPNVEKERAHRLAQMAKAERKIQAQQKEAEAIIKKAESLKIAMDSPDLITALEGLGLKPNEIYRKLTDHALKKAEAPKTPEQIKEETYEQKLKSYEETQNKLINDLNNEREMAAHTNAIATSVAPYINANTDKYEVAIDIYGGKDNFINHVYKSMWDEYNASGKSFTAQEAADLIENHWSEQIDSRLQSASKMKKFEKYFKNEAEEKVKIALQDANKPTLSRAEQFAMDLAALKKENPAESEETNNEIPKTLTNNMNSIGDSPSSIFSDSRKKQLAEFYKKNKDRY